MKKVLFCIVFALTIVFAGAQTNRLVTNTLRTYVMEDNYGNVSNHRMSNQFISIDTTFTQGDTLAFATYDGEYFCDYKFPITRVIDKGGTKIYRCNPRGNKESAMLSVLAENIHYNVYSETDEPQCYTYTEYYGILRRRTPFGYIEYKFKF